MTIFNAIRQGNLERVRELIEEDPGVVHAINENQSTPLHLAAGMGHTEIATALISAEAIIDAKNEFDYTPLHLAAQEGKLEVAKL